MESARTRNSFDPLLSLVGTGFDVGGAKGPGRDAFGDIGDLAMGEGDRYLELKVVLRSWLRLLVLARRGDMRSASGVGLRLRRSGERG